MEREQLVKLLEKVNAGVANVDGLLGLFDPGQRNIVTKLFDPKRMVDDAEGSARELGLMSYTLNKDYNNLCLAVRNLKQELLKKQEYLLRELAALEKPVEPADPIENLLGKLKGFFEGLPTDDEIKREFGAKRLEVAKRLAKELGLPEPQTPDDVDNVFTAVLAKSKERAEKQVAAVTDFGKQVISAVDNLFSNWFDKKNDPPPPSGDSKSN